MNNTPQKPNGLTTSLWMQSGGPDTDVVVSSRIRIARNVTFEPFPRVATATQAQHVLERIRQAVRQPALQTFSPLQWMSLEGASKLDVRILVEKHLISPHLAEQSEHAAVIIGKEEAVSIMVNEEDHLRMQVLYPGFQLQSAWELASDIDEAFEGELEYAFDDQWGYLTSCPTNVGTGIRASVMMHLPALVLTQQMNRILQAITQVGLAVRGLYGEGSEATGNLFQVSNQITLGQTEEEIIENLHSVVKQLTEHERTARSHLFEEMRTKITDRIRRSYGILCYAEDIDSKEAAQRLSDVRLGIDLGVIAHDPAYTMNELLVMMQPGYLQKHYGQTLSPDERDVYRAKLLREYIRPPSSY